MEESKNQVEKNTVPDVSGGENAAEKQEIAAESNDNSSESKPTEQPKASKKQKQEPLSLRSSPANVDYFKSQAAERFRNQTEYLDHLIELDKNPPKSETVFLDKLVEVELAENEFILKLDERQLRVARAIQKNILENLKIDEPIEKIILGMALQVPRIENRDNSYYTGIEYDR